MRILFVCLGNICRSPLAEGVFRHLVEQEGLSERFFIDSCGTSGYHAGDPPDPGSVRVAAAHGIDLSGQRSRRLLASDLQSFDRVVCMDASNLRNARLLGTGRIDRLRDWDPEGQGDVPDPWGGGFDGFEQVYRIIHRCCEALLEELRREGDL